MFEWIVFNWQAHLIYMPIALPIASLDWEEFDFTFDFFSEPVYKGEIFNKEVSMYIEKRIKENA